MDYESEEDFEFTRMTLGQHLEELRRRVWLALLSVLAATVACWVLYEPVIVDIMQAPLDMIAGRYDNPFVFQNPILEIMRTKLNPKLSELGNPKVLSLFEPVFVRFKVSLFAGVLIASPMVTAQLWKFVAAGLYPSERKYAVTYGVTSLFLFLFGCAFAFFILLPVAAAVLLGQTSFGVMLRLGEYVSQATLFTLGVGLVFEMPLVLLFLAKIGVVDVTSLRKKRRHVIVGILIASAMLTPPDPLTQVIVAIPMVALYEISILVLKMKGTGHEHE